VPEEELARIEVLVRESWLERYRNPRKMVYLAELALAAARKLSAENHDHRGVADIQSRAAAELGNAYRLVDRLDRAEITLKHSLVWFRRGTGDLDLLAFIAERFASLLWHRRRIPEAFALLDRLVGFYQRKGERHFAGRTLISKGLYSENAGEPKTALLLTCEGLRLIDREREPELVLTGLHNLLWCATELRHFGLVRELLPAVRPLYAGRELNLLRLRWLEGRVAAGLKERSAAEALFLEAREEFLSAKLLFAASMVSLDLALLFAEAGESRKVQEIAAELADSFRALRVGREALLSLTLLRNSAEAEHTVVGVLSSRIEAAVRALRNSGGGR